MLVVQENLRQLCVFKLGSEAGRPWVWWDYTTRFSEQCSMTSQNYGAVGPAARTLGACGAGE